MKSKRNSYLRVHNGDIVVAISLVLKCYYDEKIVYPILILSKSIFKMRQNGILGFSILHLLPEIFRFLKYANEKRITSFTHRLNKIHKIKNISANNR